MSIRTGRKRRHAVPRCMVCCLHQHLCLCHELPTVELRTRVTLIQHAKERHKPTNTGRLLARMLAGTSTFEHAREDRPVDADSLARAVEGGIVLFPLDDAPVLSLDLVAAQDRSGPLTLVLLDGTWRQARRMSRRIPALAELPVVTLPPEVTARWLVRTHPIASHVSTFEAAVAALTILEGAEAIAPLEEGFRRVTEIMWRMKNGIH